jgi:DNA-binding transcriptional ArsR family regulator
MDPENFDIKKNKLPLKKGTHQKMQKKIKGKFLKGPIPLEWLKIAAPLPGKAIQISLCIWFLKGVQRKNTVKLSYKLLKGFSVSRSSSYRGLKSLEAAGLVDVSRRMGSSPLVTILDLK